MEEERGGRTEAEEEERGGGGREGEWGRGEGERQEEEEEKEEVEGGRTGEVVEKELILAPPPLIDPLALFGLSPLPPPPVGEGKDNSEGGEFPLPPPPPPLSFFPWGLSPLPLGLSPFLGLSFPLGLPPLPLGLSTLPPGGLSTFGLSGRPQPPPQDFTDCPPVLPPSLSKKVRR